MKTSFHSARQNTNDPELITFQTEGARRLSRGESESEMLKVTVADETNVPGGKNEIAV